MSTFKIRLIRNFLYTYWTHRGDCVKVSTGIRLESKFWDEKNQRIRKNHPRRATLQSLLDIEFQRFFDTILTHQKEGRKPTSISVRQAYSHNTPIKNDFIVDSFARYIKARAGTLAKGTLNNLEYSLRSFQDFQKDQGISYTSDSFNEEVFAKWLRFQLEDKKYCDQTIQKHVKKLREMLFWAYPDREYRFVKYQIKYSSDPVFLLEAELRTLIEADLYGYLDRTRDLFVFSCLTGMRYSDCQRFSLDWVRDGLIFFRMKKTGGRAIVPMRSILLEILEKRNGFLPSLSGQKYNDYLKILFKRLRLDRKVADAGIQGGRVIEEMKPLHAVVSSHLARRTFISLSLMKGIPVQDVMKMSGHSDFDSMKPYIAITSQHLKEVVKKWDI